MQTKKNLTFKYQPNSFVCVFVGMLLHNLFLLIN